MVISNQKEKKEKATYQTENEHKCLVSLLTKKQDTRKQKKKGNQITVEARNKVNRAQKLLVNPGNASSATGKK